MWWAAFWALGVVLWVAWGLVMYWPRPARQEGRQGPLLMVIVRDQAELVEWFLRALTRMLAWGSLPTGWDLLVQDEGSSDETAAIAARLLRRSGIPLSTSEAPAGWDEPVQSAGTRQVLVLRLVRGVDVLSLLAQARWFLTACQQDPDVSCRITR